MVRLAGSADAKPVESAYDLMASAYVDKAGKELVVVLLNYSDEDKVAELSFAGLPGGYHARKFKLYETSERCDLQYKGIVNNKFMVPARSVLTLVGTK